MLRKRIFQKAIALEEERPEQRLTNPPTCVCGWSNDVSEFGPSVPSAVPELGFEFVNALYASSSLPNRVHIQPSVGAHS